MRWGSHPALGALVLFLFFLLSIVVLTIAQQSCLQRPDAACIAREKFLDDRQHGVISNLASEAKSTMEVLKLNFLLVSLMTG